MVACPVPPHTHPSPCVPQENTAVFILSAAGNKNGPKEKGVQIPLNKRKLLSQKCMLGLMSPALMVV